MFLSIAECDVGGFTCHDGTKCIPNKYKCNEIYECEDGSDEKPEICRGNLCPLFVMWNYLKTNFFLVDCEWSYWSGWTKCSEDNCVSVRRRSKEKERQYEHDYWTQPIQRPWRNYLSENRKIYSIKRKHCCWNSVTLLHFKGNCAASDAFIQTVLLSKWTTDTYHEYFLSIYLWTHNFIFLIHHTMFMLFIK